MKDSTQLRLLSYLMNFLAILCMFLLVCQFIQPISEGFWLGFLNIVLSSILCAASVYMSITFYSTAKEVEWCENNIIVTMNYLKTHVIDGYYEEKLVFSFDKRIVCLN